MISFIIAMPIALAVGLWYAFAASMLWGWFIVPVFGVPVLGVWQIFGIMLFLSALRPKIDLNAREEGWERASVAFTAALAAPALSLGVGAVIRFWVLV